MSLPATIQVDVDNIWSHLSDLGISDNSNAHVIYEESISRFSALFKEFDIKATFFCIGCDAKLPKVQKVILDLVDTGHEIANHSQNHSQKFASLTYDELNEELTQAHEVLSQLTGASIKGFKAPGWGINKSVLEILHSLGYEYDSSVMPSIMLPMMGFARYILAKGKKTGKKIGRASLWFAPQNPYYPDQKYIFKQAKPKKNAVIEIPNSVFPYIRTPMHSTFAFLLNEKYANQGIKLLAKTQTPLNYVFHAIDLLPNHIDHRLAPFPAMKKRLEKRYDTMRRILDTICSRFEIKKTIEFSRLFQIKQ